MLEEDNTNKLIDNLLDVEQIVDNNNKSLTIENDVLKKIQTNLKKCQKKKTQIN